MAVFGILAKHPERVLHVLAEAFDGAPAPRVAAVLAREQCVPELPPRGIFGLLGRDAALAIPPRFHREVELHFLIELAVEPLPPEQEQQPASSIAPPQAG